MLSICIPVYNFNISPLVNALSSQAKSIDVPFEIIVIDDCSQRFKAENKATCVKHQYIELEENVGRSKIRNLFLAHAKYDYLLFLDCDSLVENPLFLANYLATLKDNPSVVCGGRIYDQKQPGKNQLLSWKYGVEKESQAAEVRKQAPNKSFMTNNFLVKRTILEEIKFDERITKYGHEDTLFGFSLKKRNIAVTHIENPVVNGDVEENSAFLNKTREGVINLIQILKYMECDAELINDISILRFYKKVQKNDTFLNFGFLFLKPFIVFRLRTGHVNLKMFDFYKLGTLIENLKDPKNEKIYKQLKNQPEFP
ncbi:MAG: glycosyltransferase family 2 protein [Crocinitomicaceae bacterium]|nr:glycosyltransferase family 2 protein [Crocinitomicaceae bacterium]